MSTLQAGGIDVPAATNTFPYHHNEMNPSARPPPVIRLLYLEWIERRQGTHSVNENCQK